MSATMMPTGQLQKTPRPTIPRMPPRPIPAPFPPERCAAIRVAPLTRAAWKAAIRLIDTPHPRASKHGFGLLASGHANGMKPRRRRRRILISGLVGAAIGAIVFVVAGLIISTNALSVVNGIVLGV